MIGLAFLVALVERFTSCHQEKGESEPCPKPTELDELSSTFHAEFQTLRNEVQALAQITSRLNEPGALGPPMPQLPQPPPAPIGAEHPTMDDMPPPLPPVPISAVHPAMDSDKQGNRPGLRGRPWPRSAANSAANSAIDPAALWPLPPLPLGPELQFGVRARDSPWPGWDN